MNANINSDAARETDLEKSLPDFRNRRKGAKLSSKVAEFGAPRQPEIGRRMTPQPSPVAKALKTPLAEEPKAKPARKPAKVAPKAKAPAKKAAAVKAAPKAPQKAAAKPPKNAKGQEPQFRGTWSNMAAQAAKGIIPPAPDFSAETHRPFRGKMERVITLAEAGDLKGLKAFPIEPKSSSRTMIAKYRDLCVQALTIAKENGKLLTEMTADEYERKCINEANRFTATLFLGAGKYDTRECKTLAQAGKAAFELGNRAIVYAITPKGRQVMVGGIRGGKFEPTDAARELAAGVKAA